MRAKHGVCGRERSPSRLDAFVKSLEEERDYYRQETERYKRAGGAGGPDLSPSRSPGRGKSPWSKITRVRDDHHHKNIFTFSFAAFSGDRGANIDVILNFQGGVTETELLRVLKERDELKAALLDFEKHMEDIQDNVKTLSTERDKFKMLFKQVSFRNIIPPVKKNYVLYTVEDQMFLST